MAASQMLCLVAALNMKIFAWNKKALFQRERKQEQNSSQIYFDNVHRTKKSTALDYFGKELQYVTQAYRELQNKSGCNDIAVLNITFDSERWKNEALLAVEMENLLTSLWPVKTSNGRSLIENDTMLFEIVRANVLFSPSVFGSIACFEPILYRNKHFCPFAFKDYKLNGGVHVVDLALSTDYDYSTSPNAIWWTGIRAKTRNMKLAVETTDFYALGEGNQSIIHNVTRLLVRYEDGLWTRPYFDCFGGKIWMVTFLAPIFNDTREFL